MINNNKKANNESATGIRMILLAAVILLCLGARDVYAYTYTYYNRTSHLIEITIQLYDDADETCQINANNSCTTSSKSLLKSWTANAFVNDEWQQILNLTCDFLPGNHSFSIYLSEVLDANGIASHKWIAISGDGVQKEK